jgi:hypothetical protein
MARAAGHGVAVRYLRVGADGSWKLSAAAGEASVKGTGTPWLELTLVPELRVRGRVVDAEGSPIAGAPSRPRASSRRCRRSPRATPRSR